MPCPHHNQKRTTNNKYNVRFSNHNHEHSIPPRNKNVDENTEKSGQDGCKKHIQEISNGKRGERSSNSENSTYRCSNYFIPANGSHKKMKSSSTPCELHCKNGMPAAVSTNPLPKEFRHACSMCPGDFSHTSCKYCLNDTTEEKIAPRTAQGATNVSGDFSNTSCKYCSTDPTGQKDFENIEEGLRDSSRIFCKYCINNISECIEASSDSPNDSLEEFYDELNTSCLLHGPKRIAPSFRNLHCKPFQYQSRQNKNNRIRSKIHQDPSFCSIQDYTDDMCTRFKEYDDLYNRPTPFIPRLDLHGNFTDSESILYNSTINGIKLKENITSLPTSVEFKPCEFCIRNGENSVICNSHQLRSGCGDITCPILKQQICSTCGVTSDFELHCPKSNYERFVTENHVACHLAPCDLCSSMYYPQPSLETSFCHDLCCDLNEDLPHTRRSKHHINCNSSGKFSSIFSSINGGSKRNVQCQFCLANGEPPHIYNSHKMRDDAGITLTCPILKQHLGTHSSAEAVRACSYCTNSSVIEASRPPYLRRVSSRWFP